MANRSRGRVIAEGKREDSERLDPLVEDEKKAVSTLRVAAGTAAAMLAAIAFAGWRLVFEGSEIGLSGAGCMVGVGVAAICLLAVIVPWSFEENTKLEMLERVRWIKKHKRRLLYLGALLEAAVILVFVVSLIG